MNRVFAGMVLLTLFLCSCAHDNKALILGTWRGVRLDEPGKDSFFIKSQLYIDTFGKNSPEDNMKLYGLANLDSVRSILQAQLDSTKAIELNGVTHSVFTFNKDGTVISSFGGGLDTGGWSLKDNKELTLEQLTGQEKGLTQKAQILSLSAEELKLRFEKDTAFVNVTFHREGK